MHTFFRGKDGIMPKRWDTETKEKAIRLVIEHRSDYSSEWAAITTIATRLGMSTETLRKWVRQSRADADFEQTREVLSDTLDLTRDCHTAYLQANDGTRRLFNQPFFA